MKPTTVGTLWDMNGYDQTNLPISVTLPLMFERMVTDMKGALNPHDFRWGDFLIHGTRRLDKIRE